MTFLVFVIATINFGVGYYLAFHLNRRRARTTNLAMAGSSSVGVIASQTNAAAEREQFEVQAVVEEDPAAIPEEWLEVLEEVGETNSFVEAAVQVLRLEVGKYRDALAEIEQRVRQNMAKPELDEVDDILAELKVVNENWLAQQSDAAGHLSKRTGELGDYDAMGSRLEDILMDQAAQIETTCSNIDVLDFKTDAPSGCQRLVVEICRLVDMAHILRDRMHESLLTVMISEQRIQTLDNRLKKDGLTGVLNRSGLEFMFRQLWEGDPSRIRQFSVAAMDIDRFSRSNQTIGTFQGDRILAAFSQLLSKLADDIQGLEHISRLESEKFLLVFADTGPRGATSGCERLRRTISASTFMIDDKEHELTVSCGVTEVINTDTTDTMIDRLNKALRRAKKEGRDQTCLDEGNGPQVVTPPAYEVKGKIVNVV